MTLIQKTKETRMSITDFKHTTKHKMHHHSNDDKWEQMANSLLTFFQIKIDMFNDKHKYS